MSSGVLTHLKEGGGKMVKPTRIKPKKTILQRFIYLLSAHWAGEVLQVIFTIYLARYSSNSYGQFMLAINTGQLLLFTTEFGLNQHLTTILARKENYPTKTLSQITVLKLFLFIIGWLVMLVFIFSQNYSQELRTIILLIATPIALGGVTSSFFVICRILGRQDVEARTRGYASLLGYSYGITTMFAGLPSTIIACYKSIESLTSLALMVRLFFDRVKKNLLHHRPQEFWSTWKEGFVYTGMAICAIFYNKINIYFLQKYAGSEGVAQYCATWQIVDGISVLVSSLLLGKVLFPIFAKLWIKERKKFDLLARQTASWLIALALPVSYLLYAESDRIILLIYGSSYEPAIVLQKQLVGCIGLAFIHNLASYLMICTHHQRLLFVFYLMGLLVNTIACIVLIPATPLSGAAYSILITKGFMAILTVLFCQYTLKIFSWSAAIRVIAVVACSILFYLSLQNTVSREFLELFILGPFVYHLFYLYKTRIDYSSMASG